MSSVDCMLPNVALEVEDGEFNPDFFDPFERYKSVSFTVRGIVNIRCQETTQNDKIWSVERVDEYGQFIETINTNDLRSR